MSPPHPKTRPVHVAVVSRNAETLEGLEAYFQGAGVTTSSSSVVVHAPELAARASALVLFPDDYASDVTMDILANCRNKNPKTPVILVTRTPQKFEALASEDDAALTVVVPKPAWSWTILDAIRAHLDGHADVEEG